MLALDSIVERRLSRRRVFQVYVGATVCKQLAYLKMTFSTSVEESSLPKCVNLVYVNSEFYQTLG